MILFLFYDGSALLFAPATSARRCCSNCVPLKLRCGSEATRAKANAKANAKAKAKAKAKASAKAAKANERRQTTMGRLFRAHFVSETCATLSTLSRLRIASEQTKELVKERKSLLRALAAQVIVARVLAVCDALCAGSAKEREKRQREKRSRLTCAREQEKEGKRKSPLSGALASRL